MADRPMPNPFRNDAIPRTGPPGVGGRDFMRLYIMGVVLILVVGTMLWMQRKTLLGQGDEAENQKKGVRYSVNDPRAPRLTP